MSDRVPTATELLGNRAMLARSAIETAEQLREHADAIEPRSASLASTLREVADAVIEEATDKLEQHAYAVPERLPACDRPDATRWCTCSRKPHSHLHMPEEGCP